MFYEIKNLIKVRLFTLIVIMQIAILFPTWEAATDSHSFQNKYVLCYCFGFFVLVC